MPVPRPSDATWPGWLRPATVLLGSLVAALGCSRGDAPDLGRVEGTVTLDGAPLADAFVEFRPDHGRPSSCRTDEQGRYRPIYIRAVAGVRLGLGTVIISTARDEQPALDPDGMPVAGMPERLPARYNADSMLRVDVRPGTNTFDFALESTP